jgi:two-component system, NarL family, response regulator NreC
MKVLIVDDHGIVRQGLKALIRKRADFKVVGEAEDGNAAVEMASRLTPDVVIMDVTMPNLNGVDATRAIVRNCPNTKVIALSMHTDKTIVREMLRAGAYGYILKSYLFDEMNKSLEALKKGERYLSPHITALIQEDYAATKTRGAAGSKKSLSERERQILQLVAEGKSIKEMSLQLHLSTKTVDAHRRNLMTKLGATSVAALIKYAIREGLTSLDF